MDIDNQVSISSFCMSCFCLSLQFSYLIRNITILALVGIAELCTCVGTSGRS